MKPVTFNELRKINVNDMIEKKGGLSYLSWANAVDTLLQNDPTATWVFHAPQMYGQTMMVSCSVTALGKTMNMHLPVMDNRNNAVANPDARKVSDAMMRCLAKCIATFGIGLYIYAGEDVPSDSNEPQPSNWSFKQFNDQLGDGDPVGSNRYLIPFGKFAKRTLEEIPMKDLENYVIYLETKAKKEGKEITGVVAEFIDHATAFLNSFEQYTENKHERL